MRWRLLVAAVLLGGCGDSLITSDEPDLPVHTLANGAPDAAADAAHDWRQGRALAPEHAAASAAKLGRARDVLTSADGVSDPSGTLRRPATARTTSRTLRQTVEPVAPASLTSPAQAAPAEPRQPPPPAGAAPVSPDETPPRPLPPGIICEFWI
jgi:hypothetical protein